MAKYIIQGGKKLAGTVTISGSKNAALPIICATLLTEKKSVLKNVPDISDVYSMIKIIESLGVETTFEKNTLTIDPSQMKKKATPEDLVKKMRASILLLGPLVARFKEAKMAFPGGCVLGKRSVDTHTYAFEELGCQIIDDKKGLHIKAKALEGKKIVLPELSVTATENAIMAAVLVPGNTEIRLAATEPHVQDLCHFLVCMGAKITGIGTNNIHIKGVSKLNGCEYSVTGDYLEAGTFAIAAAITNGEVTIKGIDPNQLDIVLQKFKELGITITTTKNSLTVHPHKKIINLKSLRTGIYPGFPTDLQAPFSVLLTQGKGVSKIFETLFEGRLGYLFELEKMGAHVEILNPHQAIVIGPTELKAVPISSCDIRAGAAMIIAALAAKGETEISHIYYIDRGYERMHEKLSALGASIQRIEED